MDPLPIHHSSSSSKVRFVVQSTDVLQQMRINVSDEGSNHVIWYKERYLSDTEIIENIVHNASGTICWSIHRPKRGWYIRLRHPAFPPGTFIPFLPVPPSSPYHVEAALSFNSRTNTPTNRGSNSSAGSSASQASVHSYPPTPTTAYATPTSLTTMSTSEDVRKETMPSPPKMTPRAPQAMQITQFILAPHSTTPQVPTSDSFFSRALSVIKNHRPSHSKSFTLSRVPDSPHSPPPPYSSQTVVAAVDKDDGAPHPPLTSLLVHHDRTPVFTVGSFTGVIEMDTAEERMLGVDRSFWIAVALTYLEFLEGRESYLAALHD